MLIDTVLKELKFNFDKEKDNFDFRWIYTSEGVTFDNAVEFKKVLKNNFLFDPSAHEFNAERFSV